MPKPNVEDFDRLVGIDPNKLDREWIDQPQLVWRFSQREAELRYEHSVAKNRLDLTESELYLSIRADPTQYNLEGKPSEATIRAVVVSQDKYKLALESLNQFKLELDLYTNAGNALDHRKKALEKLVDLAYMNWNSDPKAKSTTGEKFREQIHEEKKQRARKGEK